MLNRVVTSSALVVGAILASATSYAADGLWTDPADKSLPADFQIQGEYVGEVKGGEKLGVQVIGLGAGALQAVVYPGGLPGAGWDGEVKYLMQGKVDGETTSFEPATGNRNYLANGADQFSAIDKFAESENKPYTASVAGGKMTGKTPDEKSFELKKTVRKSPTLGKEAPQGATVLFDGTAKSMDAWQGGRLDEMSKLLNTDGHDIKTKEKFSNYTMHVEFMLPYKPAARGQGRGNSGFYQIDLYEVQILDSFGLEGKNNECGGVYSQKASDVNACLPPLQWQTYDVEFTNAKTDDSGKKIAPARMTVKLNGIVIHDDYELTGKTGGSRSEAEGTPGPIKLQGHGNPLQFRNVWIVEK